MKKTVKQTTINPFFALALVIGLAATTAACDRSGPSQMQGMTEDQEQQSEPSSTAMQQSEPQQQSASADTAGAEAPAQAAPDAVAGDTDTDRSKTIASETE